MVVSKFKIDLGTGDIAEAHIEGDKKIGLEEFIGRIKYHGEWFVLGDTAVRTSKIKRVQRLE